MKFEWDEEKNKFNKSKHKVSFEEAKEVFLDPLQISFLDERFNYFEERWITIGKTSKSRLIVAANIYFNNEGEEIIRIISARKHQIMKENNMKTMNDNFELKNEYDFSKGIRGRFYNPHKIPTTIRLDDDIILFFKKLSSQQKIGYQTLMNSALRDYIHNHLE